MTHDHSVYIALVKHLWSSSSIDMGLPLYTLVRSSFSLHSTTAKLRCTQPEWKSDNASDTVTGCLGSMQCAWSANKIPITGLWKFSEIQPWLYLTCSIKDMPTLSMHTRVSSRNILQGSAAVLWSVINKLQVISFLSKYHICSSKQICKRTQLLINHVTYAYVYIHGHTFSHCVQLTIGCTSDMCRMHEKKKKTKHTKGSSATCNKSPVTKWHNIMGRGRLWHYYWHYSEPVVKADQTLTIFLPAFCRMSLFAILYL